MNFGTTNWGSQATASTPSGFGIPSQTTGGFAGFSLGNKTTPNSNVSGINFGTKNNTTTSKTNTSMTPLFNNPQALQMQQIYNNDIASSLGADGQTIDRIQRSYAPLRDLANRVIATDDGQPNRPNDECEFKTVMYNPRSFVNTNDISMYGTLIDQGEDHNIDHEKFIPVREIGVDALKKRFDKQNEAVIKFKENFAKLQTLLQTTETANVQISIKFDGLKRKHSDLFQTLLTVMRKVEVLRCHGAYIRSNEKDYEKRLRQLLNSLQGPQQQLHIISNKLAQQETVADIYGNLNEEDEIEFFFSSLNKQREGLEHLTEIIAKDQRDISIIKDKMSEMQRLGYKV